MKRILAVVLAAVMVLSCSMTVFAVVCIDGETMNENNTTTNTGVNVTYRENTTSIDVNVKKDSEDPQYVSVSDPKECLYITSHDVTGDNIDDSTDNPSIKSITGNYQGNTSVVEVVGDVYEKNTAHAVEADQHGVVNITGDVIEEDIGDAIYAKGGSEVTINNVKRDDGAVIVSCVNESGKGDAIYASGEDTKVNVYGNVNEENEGYAICASGKNTKVNVYGNVNEENEGCAIYAENKSEVRVGGNVTSDDKAIVAETDALILVEGIVTGDVNANTTSKVYIGKLNGKIDSNSSKSNIHYLIGTVEGSDIRSRLSIEDLDGCIAEHAQYGADSNKKKIYRYTNSADVSGKSFNLKAPDSIRS